MVTSDDDEVAHQQGIQFSSEKIKYEALLSLLLAAATIASCLPISFPDKYYLLALASRLISMMIHFPFHDFREYIYLTIDL